ncbi:fibropellin-1-like isoform X2 [Dreissena polymorpha]|uniref:fibropellin-1-like isoform X2 n=1 Tax=Dreissena polymorpha TaxID=45954 RepID=UPI002263E9E1|nr:fibropellin-1-like isoform X2 [Dreissena polymorpha]
MARTLMICAYFVSVIICIVAMGITLAPTPPPPTCPCHNGGVCSELNYTFFDCFCPPQYTGQYCEHVLSCWSSPCLHGACEELTSINSYRCECVTGFTGANCETNIDNCVGSPCMNGGACIDLLNSFTCLCRLPFSGPRCEHNPQCYSCEDMSKLDLCDTIKQCSANEVCIVQRSQLKFRSGCVNISVCLPTIHSTDDHCSECCFGNLCNGRGCGDSGMVARNERGPICLDCNHVQTIDQCTTVRPCKKYECSPIGSSRKRSVPRCKSCCDQDFCNNNCTAQSAPQAIG